MTRRNAFYSPLELKKKIVVETWDEWGKWVIDRRQRVGTKTLFDFFWWNTSDITRNFNSLLFYLITLTKAVWNNIYLTFLKILYFVKWEGKSRWAMLSCIYWNTFIYLINWNLMFIRNMQLQILRMKSRHKV